MDYHQLTSGERYTISALRTQGLTPSEISDELGRHRSTLYRELKRNACNDARYRVSKAISRTTGRRSRSRRNRQFSHKNFKIIKGFLRKKWNPMQVASTLKKSKILSISHETIYQYIWADKASGGKLYKHLRQSKKKRRLRYKSNDSRGILAESAIFLSDPRPSRNEKASDIGRSTRSGDHHCILTLVERKTGFTLIGKLRNKTKEETNACLLRLIRLHRKKMNYPAASDGVVHLFF